MPKLTTGGATKNGPFVAHTTASVHGSVGFDDMNVLVLTFNTNTVIFTATPTVSSLGYRVATGFAQSVRDACGDEVGAEEDKNGLFTAEDGAVVGPAVGLDDEAIGTDVLVGDTFEDVGADVGLTAVPSVTGRDEGSEDAWVTVGPSEGFEDPEAGQMEGALDEAAAGINTGTSVTGRDDWRIG